MQSYEKLLDRAIGKLPKDLKSRERFEIPRADIIPAGSKTIIANFVDIAQAFRRDPGHLQKFLAKELATSGELEGKRLVVKGRFKSYVVDKKIELYASEYVLCQDCGKPDTKFVKEDRYFFVKCEACGSKHVAKKI